MKFLVLDATGMAGHTISIYLKEQGHDITAFSGKPFPFCKNIVGNACELKLFEDIIKKSEFDAVINCIRVLIQESEIDKRQAVFLNSYLPHYLSDITKESNTKIIQMSTDCVFSGKKGNYSENSLRDGESFYARSKALGELENKKDLTFRTSIIGPDMNKDGIGLFNWFIKQQGEINGYTKAIWTGVTSLTLAKAMEKATEYNLTGLYNLANNETINKYEMLKLFNKYFKKNQIIINQSDDVNLNRSLINSRTDFDFIIPSYEDMIKEMKEWIVNHKELYPYYSEQI